MRTTKSEFKIVVVVVDVAFFKNIRQEEQSRYVGGDFFCARELYGKRQTDNRIDRQVQIDSDDSL